MSVLAGTDFFTAEVLTWRGLATYYVLFFLHLRLDALPSLASLDTPQKPGSPKWRATLLTTQLGACGSVATCCMTAIPNSAVLSMRSWLQKASAV